MYKSSLNEFIRYKLLKNHCANFPKAELKDVSGVLIDIDNTLYNYAIAHEGALQSCYNSLSGEISGLNYDDFVSLYTQKRENVTRQLEPQGACRSRLFAFQELFEEKNFKQPYNHALAYENHYWSSFLENMVLFPEAKLFLEECEKLNIPVCAVTDMQAHFQIQKLQKLGVDKLIDFLVTSEEVGVEKPSSKIFKKALQKISLSAENVIMIGDNEKKDGIGAKSLNIRFYKIEVNNATGNC